MTTPRRPTSGRSCWGPYTEPLPRLRACLLFPQGGAADVLDSRYAELNTDLTPVAASSEEYKTIQTVSLGDEEEKLTASFSLSSCSLPTSL